MIKFFFYTLCCVAICAGKNSKIIGGFGPVNIQECPFVVSLQYQGHHMCGATIVTQYHVISSASCVLFDIDSIEVAANLQILTGTNDRFNSDNAGQYHNVQYVIYHPKYKPKSFWKNDISILKLETPIIFSQSSDKVELSLYKRLRNPSTVTYGWGENYFLLVGPTKRLRRLRMNIQIKYRCDVLYKKWPKFYDGQGCAQAPDVSSGVTKGNGGNGMFHTHRIVGIISLYDVISLQSVVYTDIFHHTDFIFNTLMGKY